MASINDKRTARIMLASQEGMTPTDIHDVPRTLNRLSTTMLGMATLLRTTVPDGESRCDAIRGVVVMVQALADNIEAALVEMMNAQAQVEPEVGGWPLHGDDGDELYQPRRAADREALDRIRAEADNAYADHLRDTAVADAFELNGGE